MSSSIPAAATDSKTAHLLQEEEPAPIEAPPSYADSSKPAPPVIGDGNVFSDLPRPGMTRPGMTYGPGQAQVYIPRDRKGTWSFGLFSCFSDPAAAIKACFCPCVSYGQTRHRLHNPNSEAPVFSTPCLGYCLTGSFIPGAESIFGLLNRNELRQRLDIDQPPQRIVLPGGRTAPPNNVSMFEGVQSAIGFAHDSAAHLFCGCCALTQEDREVRLWERQMEEEGLSDLRGLRQDEEEAVLAEGDHLLGSERSELRGLRG
ncbi:PLAC8 family-domain-containing protein [Pyronema domesticum]|uniref:Similar to Protein PLANT CADMIUM RESISTANCE 7 acc. no. Q9LS43 n=1 Tax=Pyronema omphalodes (strain CBS 100304) TaxID=1076935 RepID=U4LBU7_PYROM|nr:PLAC8 family-domain-containing protein [Pyronema domesticum]CCX07782.1 Similar to Protein PLANT CADMIUM RESISTANCE 7; acc. no. Q9LS43 [Pyronema omphalodes CBS 100304]